MKRQTQPFDPINNPDDAAILKAYEERRAEEIRLYAVKGKHGGIVDKRTFDALEFGNKEKGQ